MLHKYFEKPVFWDYFLALLLVIIALLLDYFNFFSIPNPNTIQEIVSDLSTVSFTSAGFILTFITLLITFKGNSRITKDDVGSRTTIFDAFFTSELYDKTINKLKDAVKSLILVALMGYVVKLILVTYYTETNFLYCIYALVIIVLTLWRTLVILTNILNMQNE